MDGDSSFALDRLLNSEVTFAFVGMRSRRSIFSYHTVCRDRMVLITPNTPEFAQKKQAGILGRELFQLPLIVRESGSGTRRETDNYLKSIGVSPANTNVAAYMNNIEGIKSMVAGGGGNTIISEHAAADAIREGRVLCFALEKEGPFRNIYIAYLKNICLTSIERTDRRFAGNGKGISSGWRD